MRRFPVVIWLVVGAVYASLLVCAFTGGYVMSPELGALVTEKIAPLPPFGSVWALIEQEFYGDLPPADVRVRAAARGMLEALNDPYTSIVDPQPAKHEQQRLAGRYGDVGLSLWWTPGGGHIGLTPYPEGPAAQAGICEGDYLLAVDGTTLITQTLTLEDLGWALQGEVGTTVTLGILHPPSERLTVTVKRNEVLHPSVEWRVLEGKMGYLKIAMFTSQTAAEVAEALKTFQVTGVHGLVLDLRGNYGGVIAPLPSIGGMFLPEDAVIYYVTEHHQEHAIRVIIGDVAFKKPVAVLVDHGTASASEILAGALQDHERAILIGGPTYGKGSVQSLYPLSDGSNLHLTTAVWTTPKHKQLDGVGLQPDLAVEAAPGQDMALDAAIAHLETATK
jgi:carboxyl-terminal processing protease